MIDIQSYFMSLKASWVSRLVSNQLLQDLYFFQRFFGENKRIVKKKWNRK
jgi:high-affinity nickel permease